MDPNAPLIDILWNRYQLRCMDDEAIKQLIAPKLINFEFWAVEDMELKFGDTVRCDLQYDFYSGADRCYSLSRELCEFTGAYILDDGDLYIEICDRCYSEFKVEDVLLAIRARIQLEKDKAKPRNVVKPIPNPGNFPKECFPSNQSASPYDPTNVPV